MVFVIPWHRCARVHGKPAGVSPSIGLLVKTIAAVPDFWESGSGVGKGLGECMEPMERHFRVSLVVCQWLFSGCVEGPGGGCRICFGKFLPAAVECPEFAAVSPSISPRKLPCFPQPPFSLHYRPAFPIARCRLMRFFCAIQVSTGTFIAACRTRRSYQCGRQQRGQAAQRLNHQWQRYLHVTALQERFTPGSATRPR